MSKLKSKKYAMSSSRRRSLFGLCLLSVAFLVWLDHQGRSTGTISTFSVTQKSDSANPLDFEKYHGRIFTVSKVVDGDTLDIDIPDGNYQRTRIRLLGIDTPETKSPAVEIMYFGPEAAKFTAKTALGKKVCVFLDSISPARDKYGRILAYIQLPDGNFLNELLLKEGFAYADLRFRHSFYNKYPQLEALARNQKKGLWQNAAREQLPKWLQRKKPKLLLK